MIPCAPVEILHLFDDPEAIYALLARHAPYAPVQSYSTVMANPVEQAVITGTPIDEDLVQRAREGGAQAIAVAPIFRRYFALVGEALVDGAREILDHPRLAAAARQLLCGGIVRPVDVYVQPTCAQPNSIGRPHIDTPMFRGFARRDTPVWLPMLMRLSGLFERWRVRVATAVIWFYEGSDGYFLYWPAGPDAPPRRTFPPYSNRAVVGENDSMYHSGEPIHPAPAPLGLTMQSELWAEDGGGTWQIVDRGRSLARYPRSQVRIAISWSAMVLRDEAEARMLDEHEDDLEIETVVEYFLRDLAARGVHASEPSDPWHELEWIALLARHYQRLPTQRESVEHAA